MKQVTRKELREVISTKGIEPALRLGRTGLTAKQKKFAEGLVLEGLTGADAYRNAYDTSAKPKRVGNAASLLKQHEGIKSFGTSKTSEYIAFGRSIEVTCYFYAHKNNH